ncbi:MAG: class I SAM-dependent methyltransferase [Candidatus Micrarchaeota archaeon]
MLEGGKHLTEYLHQLKQLEFTDFWLQAKSSLFLDYLPAGCEKTVLDLGAGTGLLTFKLAQLGWDVDALEPSKEATEWIQDKVAQFGSRVSVINKTLEAFSTRKKYSVVAMADVLEHIGDDEAALAKIHGLLARGGTLLLSVPANPWLWSAHDVHCLHCRRYGKPELRRKLEKHFLVKTLRSWNFAMLPVALANKLLYKREYPHKAVNSVGFLNEALKSYYLAVENKVPFPAGITLFAAAVKQA